MKFNTLFLSLSLLFNLSLVFSQNTKANVKSFTIGKKYFCEDVNVKKDDKLYYAALPSELMEDKSNNCNKNVVAMIADPEAKGKYRFVKAIIKDVCLECKMNEIRLSSKSIIDIKGSRKGTVFWGILSNKGEFVNGPFTPVLSDKDIKKLLKASGEKDLNDVIGKFISKAKELVKSKKTHLKEFPWEIKAKAPTHKKITKKVTVTNVKKVKVIKTKSKAKVYSKSTILTPDPTGVSVTQKPTEIPATKEPTEVPVQKSNTSTVNLENNEKSSNTGVVTGAVAVSLAAGAALLLVRRKSSRKNYIFGEPLDKYNRSLDKELIAKTKDGKQIKLKIPYHDFNDIAHIQIFSPSVETANDPNIDVFNVHQERAIMSDNESISLPQPQEQPQPHDQLPIPSSNDFLTMFSPVDQIAYPDFAACPKENIGAYDPTSITARVNDDPYLVHFEVDDSKEIYDSVPKITNQAYTSSTEVYNDDILLDYVEGEEYYK